MSKALDTLLDEDPLDSTADVILAVTNPITVPTEYPTLTLPYRIALIGDFPSRDELLQGKPFQGYGGRLLNQMFQYANTMRAGCLLRYIGEGLDKDLEAYNPNICLLLGQAALNLAKDNSAIGDWRGSFFIATKPGPFFGRKCIASYNPTKAMQVFEWVPLLRLDLIKAKSEALSADLVLPQRNLTINLTAHEIVQRLLDIQNNHTIISIDIEGYIGRMSCISISSGPTDAFIIPFTNSSGGSYWSFDDELLIWSVLSSVLADHKIGKILQNCLYDRFVLQYSYACVVCGTVEDTMLKSWERYCELEKGLGFLCSIYTKEPYYKSDRKNNNLEAHWRYCCKDSAVTYEISNTLTPFLKDGSLSHYHFNLDLLNPILFMEHRGIKYDSTLAQQRLSEVNTHIYVLQVELDQLSGFGTKGCTDKTLLLQRVRETCCHKKDQSRAKKEFETSYSVVERFLLSEEPLTDWWKGFISMTCEWSMNVKSDAYKDYLYETLKLPIQYNIDPKTKKKSRTTDAEALLTLKKKHPHRGVELGIHIMEMRTRGQDLSHTTDEDGRMRAAYNVVGAVTGRVTCSKSPTGSGFNLTTVPDNWLIYPVGHPLRQGMRDLFLADEGYHFFQCDLKGSDGWTIGAELAALGDPAMLEDLRYGIKPAARICYMLRHGNNSLMGKQRAEVKTLLKSISKEDWDYFACKVGIWGICYLMGPELLNAQIQEESLGAVSLSRTQIIDFRNAVYSAYHPQTWHRAMEHRLAKSPVLVSPSGHSRRFFGRSNEILGQALAHLPQSVTTYATNLAAWRLWNDKENRFMCPMSASFRRTLLRIEPLHQVHDALLGQFKKSDTDWSVNKIKVYFDNEITIAGTKITIPFEGNYGPSWGQLDVGTI